jgi:hypothetical protein
MIDRGDDDDPPSDVDAGLADLIEELTRRIEAGDPVTGGELGDDPDYIGTIRQLLPTLRTMVSLGNLVLREDRSRTRVQSKTNETRASLLDAIPEAEEFGP